MNKLLIASTNVGKVKEFKNLLKFLKPEIEVVSLADLKITTDVEETGKTFAENSQIKADFYFSLTNIPVLSDDGGFEIDYLNGEPGVKSRRWLGYEMTDQELIDEVLKRMTGVKKNNRKCRLKLILTLKISATENHQVSGTIEGVITKKQETPIIPGFPYRSIMFIPAKNKMFSDFTEQDHQDLNFRKQALEKLKEKL